MPSLIRLEAGPDGPVFRDAADPFRALAPGEEPAAGAAVLAPLDRFRSEGEGWLDAGLTVGVRLAADEGAETLSNVLPRLALVALDFPIFRDGRAYTSATLLRERLRWTGELRAVGDVLREQAWMMVRCGFDSFAPADSSTAEQWAQKAGRFRHVYQPAADGRIVAWTERSPFPLEGGRVGDGGAGSRWGAQAREASPEDHDRPAARTPSPGLSPLERERS